MSDIITTAIAIASDLNGPPGIIHPLLQENYDWVDKHLEELYYGYALTEDNYDEYINCDLISDKWSSMDSDLENQNNNIDFLPCPASIVWVNYRSFPSQHRIESMDDFVEHRNRAESDISDHIEEIYRAVSCSTVNNDYYDYYLDISSPRSCESESKQDELLHFGSCDFSDWEVIGYDLV